MSRCTLTLLEQGFLICSITGCCVRGISFSEQEYIDTVGAEAGAKRRIDVAPFVHRAPVCSWDNTRSVPLSRHAGRYRLVAAGFSWWLLASCILISLLLQTDDPMLCLPLGL